MRFLVFLFFSVLCSCLFMYYDLLQSYKAQSLPQKDLFYLKEKADPDRAKMAHSNTKYLRNAAQMCTQRKKAWFQ